MRNSEKPQNVVIHFFAKRGRRKKRPLLQPTWSRCMFCPLQDRIILVGPMSKFAIFAKRMRWIFWCQSNFRYHYHTYVDMRHVYSNVRHDTSRWIRASRDMSRCTHQLNTHTKLASSKSTAASCCRPRPLKPSSQSQPNPSSPWTYPPTKLPSPPSPLSIALSRCRL